MKTRNYFFDNAKGILIFLVVFGHLLSPYKHDYEFVKIIHDFIYVFHMPFFILISGFFVKNNLKKEIQFLLVYFIINVFLAIIFKGKLIFFTPQFAMWYLLALFFWKQLLKFFKNFKYSLLIAILIGIMVGFSKNLGSFLTLQRTFVFFPFFLLGYQLNDLNYKDYLKKISKSIALIGLSLIIISIAVLVLKFDIRSLDQLLMGKKNYYILLKDNYLIGFLLRLGGYILSFITIFLLSKFISHEKIKFLSHVGNNSLSVYLIHIFIIKIFYSVNFFDIPLNLIFLIIISTSIVIFLTSKPILYLFNLLINNQFLKNNFFKKDHQEEVI